MLSVFQPLPVSSPEEIFAQVHISHLKRTHPVGGARLERLVEGLWPLLSCEEQAEWERLSKEAQSICTRIADLDRNNWAVVLSIANARQQAAMKEINPLTTTISH